MKNRLNFKKLNKFKITIFIFSLFLLYLFYSYGINPYPEVEWIRDYPGATSKYIEYQPVLASDKSINVGPKVGADYGELYFKDTNNDGTAEAIIETDSFLALEDYIPEIHVLEYRKHKNGKIEVVLVKSETLQK